MLCHLHLWQLQCCLRIATRVKVYRLTAWWLKVRSSCFSNFEEWKVASFSATVAGLDGLGSTKNVRLSALVKPRYKPRVQLPKMSSISGMFVVVLPNEVTLCLTLLQLQSSTMPTMPASSGLIIWLLRPLILSCMKTPSVSGFKTRPLTLSTSPVRQIWLTSTLKRCAMGYTFVNSMTPSCLLFWIFFLSQCWLFVMLSNLLLGLWFLLQLELLSPLANPLLWGSFPLCPFSERWPTYHLEVFMALSLLLSFNFFFWLSIPRSRCLFSSGIHSLFLERKDGGWWSILVPLASSSKLMPTSSPLGLPQKKIKPWTIVPTSLTNVRECWEDVSMERPFFFFHG